MKIKKGAVISIIVIALIVIAVYGATMAQRYKSRGELAEQIFSASSTHGDGTTPTTIEGLKAAIAMYEKQIEQYVKDAAKTGTYWKILAVRLQDRGLHGEALEALEHAIYYTPLDPTLHYYTGVSAGIMAKSIHAFPGRENTDRNRYFALAEESYLRAIELDDRYLRPRYGLGVLYVFELDRPEDAVPHLERCLEISRNDVDTMFVLARAFYMLKKYQESLDLYDRIITLTKDGQKKIDAQNNRQTILGLVHG